MTLTPHSLYGVIRSVKSVYTVQSDSTRSGTELGDAIAFHRARCDMSQDQVASAVGVRQATVSDWENGIQEPGKANRTRLEIAFGLVAGTLKRPPYGLFPVPGRDQTGDNRMRPDDGGRGLRIDPGAITGPALRLPGVPEWLDDYAELELSKFALQDGDAADLIAELRRGLAETSNARAGDGRPPMTADEAIEHLRIAARGQIGALRLTVPLKPRAEEE